MHVIYFVNKGNRNIRRERIWIGIQEERDWKSCCKWDSKEVLQRKRTFGSGTVIFYNTPSPVFIETSSLFIICAVSYREREREA